MGKVLQIRVIASTYDADDVYKTWPRLSKLAWGDKRFAGKKPIGVRELVADLEDLWKFGDEWPDDTKTMIGNAVPNLQELDGRLESALANRDAEKADKISYEIEDALDELEGLVK
ncbi:hypothetical protein [Desulfonatronum parangueonense]